jgi:DNA repair and recombination protein RAD52
MSKTKEQILNDLDANIPKSAVEQRQGGGASKLSYLAGWYVIDRLNKIFGPDAWSYDVSELRNVHSGDLDGKYGKIFSASYVATVQLYVQFPDGTQAKRITDVGFGNGTDKTDPGKPHELATKEAVTDALKRCAKSLGMSLGLALYDKKQENVGDEEPAPKVAPWPKDPVAAKERAITELAVGAAKVDAINNPMANREALNKRITAMSEVVIAKRLKTLEELKADMKSKYGADSKAGLDDAEAKDLLTSLEAMANA